MRCSIINTQQNNNDKLPSSVIIQSVVSAKCMVSIMFLCCYTQCHNTECSKAECRYAECRVTFDWSEWTY